MVRNRSIGRSALLAVVAVFVFSGIAAASASAYTNPILVNAKGEAVSKVKFTGVAEGRTFYPFLIKRGALSNVEAGKARVN